MGYVVINIVPDLVTLVALWSAMMSRSTRVADDRLRGVAAVACVAAADPDAAAAIVVEQLQVRAHCKSVRSHLPKEEPGSEHWFTNDTVGVARKWTGGRSSRKRR